MFILFFCDVELASENAKLAILERLELEVFFVQLEESFSDSANYDCSKHVPFVLAAVKI